MEGLSSDLRLALRGFRRTPGFTVAAVIALALGIGATTAIFSVVHAALLQSLGWNDEARLVAVRAAFPGHGLLDLGPSLPEYEDVRAMPFIEAAGAYTSGTAALVTRGEAERVLVADASSSFFSTLGVEPLYGRLFTESEDLQGSDGVALLSERALLRRYGGDPSVVGRTVTLDGMPRTIVGVVPASFHYGPDQDFYLPFGFTPAQLHEQRTSHGFEVVARLRRGVSLAQAEREIEVASDRIRAEHPESYSPEAGWRFRLVPLRQELLGKTREPLLLLFGGVLLVLFIACGNVANLLLARGAARERELAVRAALGAARGRIVRQLLTESLLLALAGGALGVAAAGFGLDALLASAPAALRAAPVRVDQTVLAFALLSAAATAVVFGLWPALRASRTALHGSLKHAAIPQHRLGGTLVALQVALAVVLLASAGLLLRSFDRLLRAPLGFEADGVIAAGVSLAGPAYDDHPEARVAYFDRALRGISALPGVQAVGAVDVVPATGLRDRSYEIEAHQPRQGEPQPEGQCHAVAPGYFETLRVPLLQGRALNAADDARSTLVAVVNLAWVRRYFPGQSPLGRRLRLATRGSQPAAPWRTVVGVVGDVREAGIDRAAPPSFYLPYAQFPPDQMDLVARAPAGVMPLVRKTLFAVDASQPIDRISPLPALLEGTLSPRRFPMQLFTAFAAVALFLCALGIYGVTSYTVAQRNREIALRMACGATGERVLRMVLAGALRTATAGAAAGLAAALLFSRALSSMLYGVSATDPVTYAFAVALFAVIALVASAVPALRASRTDPMTALRSE